MTSSRLVSGLVFASFSALVGLSACSGGPSSIVGVGDGGASSIASEGEDANPEACAATCPSGDKPPTSDSGLKMTVSNPMTSDVLINYISSRPRASIAQPGNLFVVVTVEIENVSNPQPASTGSAHFLMKTAQGIVYNPWSGADRIPNNCVGHGSVAQGGKSQPCNLAFEFPVSEQPGTLLYAYSSSESSRAAAPIPVAKAGPPAFCDRVNVTDGAVSQVCVDCVQKNCFSTHPTVDLEPGTCPTAPYCRCEKQAYDLHGQGSAFENFEGCINVMCASICIPQ